jgi:subtilisin inhibitor-like
MGSLARLGLLVGLLVLAGCGSGTGGGDAAEPPPQPGYDLTITYWPEGNDGTSRTSTLTCDPAGGTHADPAKACAALDAHPEALHPVPTDMACTEIYGGDQVAEVKGTGPDGAELRAILNRSNGCEIARWDALAPLVELPG